MTKTAQEIAKETYLTIDDVECLIECLKSAGIPKEHAPFIADCISIQRSMVLKPNAETNKSLILDFINTCNRLSLVGISGAQAGEKARKELERLGVK
jgi:hypothetical protein